MADLVIQRSVTALGRSFSFSKTVTADGAVTKEPPLPAAKAGTLSTRSGDTSGTLTLESGHGVASDTKLDVYWADGTRVNVTVGTVSGTSVPITSGSGDNLPAQGTAVTVMAPHEEEWVVTAANMTGLAVGCSGTPCVARFVDSEDADVVTIVVNPGSQAYAWAEGMGDNPITDDVAKVFLSHGSSAGVRRPTATAMID